MNGRTAGTVAVPISDTAVLRKTNPTIEVELLRRYQRDFLVET